jgi:hypothetical protein
MKNVLKNITLGLFLIGLGSCQKLDLNINPVETVTVPARQRLPAIQSRLAISLYSQARYTAFHSYYFTSRTGNSSGVTDTWNYNNNITRMGAWRWHYFDVGSNLSDMITRAQADNSNNFVGVGKILMGLSFLSATDVFGDMPFSQAYSGSFNPVYDSQEEVMQGVEKLLDEGIAELNNVNQLAATMDESSDIIYEGNYTKWKALALAVKARLKLRTANFRNGHQELLTIVNDALVNFDDALFEYPENSTSPWTHNLWGPSPPPLPPVSYDFPDIRSDQTLPLTLPTDVLMKSLTVNASVPTYDPRLFVLTTPGENNKYLGAKMSEGLLDASLPGGTTFRDFANLHNGYWTSNDSPHPIMLKEELYFIKAETQFYLNDPGAFTSYQQGIRHNMERLGIPEGQIISYLGSAKVAQSAATLSISDIMLQKYIALYLQPETWSDMRRYGYSTNAYPNLYYPRFALAEWGGRYIQRLPYDPQTEYVYNPKEIERLGARARDWVFKPVWWAENSTLKN